MLRVVDVYCVGCVGGVVFDIVAIDGVRADVVVGDMRLLILIFGLLLLSVGGC